jgi:hypothetical protein
MYIEAVQQRTKRHAINNARMFGRYVHAHHGGNYVEFIALPSEFSCGERCCTFDISSKGKLIVKHPMGVK